MTVSVFDQSTTTDVSTSTDQTGDTTTSENTYVSDLVGEGKKFKTVGDLEKGKTEADAFILKLQDEQKTLREELDKRTTVDEAIEKLKGEQSNGDNTSQALDADAISKLVSDQILNNDATKSKETNEGLVSDKLIETHGEKVGEFLTNKAKELGVSVEYLQGTAGKSPKAFFNLIGMQDTPAASASSQGNVNHAALGSQGDTKAETWESFEKIRKENPRKYFTPKIQNAIFKAKMEGLI